MEMSIKTKHYEWQNLGFSFSTEFVNRWPGDTDPKTGVREYQRVNGAGISGGIKNGGR